VGFFTSPHFGLVIPVIQQVGAVADVVARFGPQIPVLLDEVQAYGVEGGEGQDGLEVTAWAP